MADQHKFKHIEEGIVWRIDNNGISCVEFKEAKKNLQYIDDDVIETAENLDNG
jgi:hypothetical protein